VIVEKGEFVTAVEIRKLVYLVAVPRRGHAMMDVEGAQKLDCLNDFPVNAGVVTSPARDLIDVEVDSEIGAVPAGPCCAAALPATDAVVVVVLCVLVVPGYRPALLVLEWVSFVPGGGKSYVGPGKVLVDGL
jgi:hypothetical protein